MNDQQQLTLATPRPRQLVKKCIVQYYGTRFVQLSLNAGREVVYIDGFAGDGGEHGAARGILRSIQKLNLTAEQLGRLTFYFNDLNNAHELYDMLQHFPRLRERVRITEGPYETVMPHICRYLRQDMRVLAFIDPFGIKDSPMAIKKALKAKCPESEILFNLMSGTTWRSVSNDKINHHAVCTLWGVEEGHIPHMRQAIGEGGDADEKRKVMSGLYSDFLRDATEGFAFVKTLAVVCSTPYHWIFGTDRLKHVELFNYALTLVTQLDNIGAPEVVFRERDGANFGQISYKQLMEEMVPSTLRRFSGQSVRMVDLVRWMLVDNPYRALKTFIKKLVNEHNVRLTDEYGNTPQQYEFFVGVHEDEEHEVPYLRLRFPCVKG